MKLNDKQMEVARYLANRSTYRAFDGVLPGSQRSQLFNAHRQFSTKHDYNFDFGYPDDVNFYDLYQLYKRNGVANGVVNKTVGKTWETMPALKEGADAHDETPLEAEIRKRFQHIRFWQQLMEADKRFLVGEYSGVIFQLADSKPFSEPVERVPGGLNGLVNLIPAWEGQLEVTQWDQDEKSPTYGEAQMMTFTESAVDSDRGKTRAFQVHPSRVYIWSQDRTTFNDSDLEAAYNAFLDMEKIRGASGQGFWKNAKSQPVLEADKDVDFAQLAQMLGTDVSGLPEALDEVVADWSKGFDQSLTLQGMKAYTLGVNMPQPEEFYSIAAREVSASWNIPEKVLFGNQTGERASTEDASSWNRHNMARRNNYVIPNIMDVIAKLVSLGIIPERDWSLDWADLTGATAGERMETAKGMADVNQKMAPTGGVVFTDDEIRDAMDYAPLDDEEDFSELEEEGESDD